MRYYQQRYPEVDELVMVQVRQIAEMGAYVKLVSTSNRELLQAMLTSDPMPLIYHGPSDFQSDLKIFTRA